MSQPSQTHRFVDRSNTRAKHIREAVWNEHKEELRSLYQQMTLDELMSYMKDTYGFEPSQRQYIYKFEKWGFWKYNTTARTHAQPQDVPPRSRIRTSAPARAINDTLPSPTVPPKRSKSTASLQSHDDVGNFIGNPRAPPSKRQKLAQYMTLRESASEIVTYGAASIRPRQPQVIGSTQSAPTIGRLASLGLQFASTGHPTHPRPSSFAHFNGSLHNLASSGRSRLRGIMSNAPRPFLASRDRTATDERSEDELDSPSSMEKTSLGDTIFESRNIKTPSNPRRFDSSRPIHTFSEQELLEMKLAADFLCSIGFDNDAFELFTILLHRLKESNSQPAWARRLALIRCVRSAFHHPQVDIARMEICKTLKEPRHLSTEAEYFLYRMLLAEIYARSGDTDNAGSLNELAIACESASDKMLDDLPDDHRCYDILMYHYLNKCLEYLNTYVQDTRDDGTIFTNKEHLQIRLLERIPGPFELRRGVMRNRCLRSCLEWCAGELEVIEKLPNGWKDLQSCDHRYVYWTDHIGLYCALWERWRFQRLHHYQETLPIWMRNAEDLMGITTAELLSNTCGLIMSAPTPNLQSREGGLIDRARNRVQAVSLFSDKELGRHFLDTFSLLRTFLTASTQRQHHDAVSLYARVVNSTPERDVFSERARAFGRTFIERNLDMILPSVHHDVPLPIRHDSPRVSFQVRDHRSVSMNSLATAITPFFAASTHSSDLSVMRSLRDEIQRATRRSMDYTVTVPSSLARVQTMSQLSQAMATTLTLSSAQEAANAAADASAAAASRDLYDPFGDWDMDSVGDQHDKATEG